MSNEPDNTDQNLEALVSGLKTGTKTLEMSSVFYGDIEWRLLTYLLLIPDLIQSVLAVGLTPRHFRHRASCGTSHKLLFSKMAEIKSADKDLNFVTLYEACEAGRGPFQDGYSRADIFELEAAFWYKRLNPDLTSCESVYIAELMVNRK